MVRREWGSGRSAQLTSPLPKSGNTGTLSMKLQTSLFACAIGAAISPCLAAQDLLGHWDAATMVPTQAAYSLYVDAANTGPADGSVNNPYPTITDALVNWVYPFHGHPTYNPGVTPVPFNFSINVKDGTYATETWPLELPANGVSLESWFDEDSGPDARAILQPGGGVEAIRVNWLGIEELFPSVIQGLQIEGGTRGILVDPAQLSTPGTEPVSVEIRDNIILGSFTGIELQTRAHWASLYVIEGNEIGDNLTAPGKKQPMSNGNAAVLERCEQYAAASTLYRSNRAQLYDTIIDILSVADPINGNLPCVPRIFSNHFQLGETIVSTDNCDTFLINNTLAFAVNYGATPVPTTLSVTGGQLEYHNNIVWSPDTAFPYFAASPTDEVIPAGTIATTNLVFDVTPAALPFMASGDFLPVPYAGLMDLHLTAGSVNAIGLGTNDSAADMANDTVRSWQFDTVPVGIMTVRTDVNLDVDYDSRISNSGVVNGAEAVPTVDIGGDEFKFEIVPGRRNGRLEMTRRDGTAPDTQNALGVVIPDEFPMPGSIDRSWSVELFADGPANGLFIIYAGFGFDETILDVQAGGPTITTQNDHVYQNLFLDVFSLGSLGVDPDPAITLNLGSGAFDAMGVGSFPVNFYFDDLSYLEAETHFQMVILDPATGRWSLSNRLKVELDDRAEPVR